MVLSNQEGGICRQRSEVCRGRRDGLCWAQDVGGRIGDVTLADHEGYEEPAEGL